MSDAKIKILVANGVNLDLLGQREVEHYGKFDLRELEHDLQAALPAISAAAQKQNVELHFFQSNDESAFLAKLSEPWHGIVLNPGAWTHYSIALVDRLAALKTPFVEVHISNLARREEFRQKSVSAPHSSGVVQGLGMYSYHCGLLGLLRVLP